MNFDINSAGTVASTLQDTSLLKFREDALKGLLASPKQLHAKYFYDKKGSELFQEIMNLPEYYLTDCELDIFKNKTAELSEILTLAGTPFDLIELGAGDGYKSKHLLHQLYKEHREFTYMPVDISGSILDFLGNTLQSELPELEMKPLKGEYMDMLAEACAYSSNRKVVLFLGANIGNMEDDECRQFCQQLHGILSPGDMVLIGFDLKKNPKQILSAYNDAAGVTARFNLNLLERMNEELGAGFVLDQFEHYPTYDPLSGACRSFLVSMQEQQICIDGQTIHFKKNEIINMEVSKKYDPAQIYSLATQSGFETVGMIMDAKEWFVDAVWKIKPKKEFNIQNR